MAHKGSVVIIDSVFDDYVEERNVIEPAGFKVIHCRPDEQAELAKHLPGCVGLLVNTIPVDAKLISSLRNCKIIARYGVGYDTVDVAAAAAKGIWVANVQGYAAEDVSDHTVAMLFAAVRRLAFRDREVRQGGWNLHRRQTSARTSGKVLGIIGFGSIGRAVRRKLSGVDFSRVLVWDPLVDPSLVALAGGIATTLDALFDESDYITLHLPLNDDTYHLIDHGAFKRMKSSSILVNTSRGGIVDTDALIAALESGEIGYAALDVYEAEPIAQSNPLLSFDNVILTDHCGWYSEESVAELKRKTAENVREALLTGRPVYPVDPNPLF